VNLFVDPDRCAGHGACVATCPAVFGFTDDGFAEVLVATVPDDLAGFVDQSIRHCPEQAIRTADPAE
jgi:ferredoxin